MTSRTFMLLCVLAIFVGYGLAVTIDFLFFK